MSFTSSRTTEHLSCCAVFKFKFNSWLKNCIVGYYCKVCNYVHFSKRRVSQHISDGHQQASLENCVSIKLLDLNVVRAPYTQNIDKSILYAKKKYRSVCLLCDSVLDIHGQPDIVQHCIAQHPNNEIYTSRLSIEMAERCRNGSLPPSCRTIDNQFEALCVFCEDTCSFTKAQFIEHITSHTGEFQYECSLCNKALIKTANHHHDQQYIRQLSNFQSKKSLYAFICNLCNYVQLQEQQMKEHIANTHFCGNSTGLITEIKLVDFSSKYAANAQW